MRNQMQVLAATLALTAIAVGYYLVQRPPARPGPRLEPRPAAARPIAPPPVVTAHSLLEQGAALSLTKSQAARLEALDQRWQAEVAGLEAAVREEEAAFARFMQEAQGAGKTSVQEIQRRSADLRAVSETLRERRQMHTEAALEVLTASQRQMLSGTAVSAQGGV